MFSTTSLPVNKPNTQYRLGMLAVCLCYLVFQMIYIPYAVLAHDELWFAHHIYQYTQHIPYRDFAPYKTVLGYYLFSIPMYFSQAILAPLYYIKDEIAILNTVMLGGIALWASRWFQPRAIFYTLLIIISSQLFLIYSTELRVDMLTSWLCLISVLFVLSNRVILAGFVLAVGFLVSQKVLWYFIATNGAFVIYGFAVSEPRKTVRAWFQFHIAMLSTLIVYVGVWSCFSSVSTVLHSVFYEAYTQSKISFYAPAYWGYWRAILQNGPLLILLWPLTFVSLFDAKLDEQQRSARIFKVSYASLAIFMMAIYQQFFPYNIVFFVPAFFVLYADFFSWVLDLFKRRNSESVTTLRSRTLFWFFASYVLGLIIVVAYFTLPLFYLTIIFIPVAFWSLLENPSTFGIKPLCVSLQWMMIVTILLTGIFNPLMRMSIIAYQYDGNYQKQMIFLTNALLHDQEEYIAGVPLFYNKDQTVAGLKNLIAPAIQYLYRPTPALLPVLLGALDMEPRTADEVLQDLQQKPIKVVVNNYRIAGLPPRILNYLRSEFVHYWGGIYLYAPTVVSGARAFVVKFTAVYQVESPLQQAIVIDGKTWQPNAILTLTSGEHHSQSLVTYRLRFLPINIGIQPDLATYHDCHACFAKPITL